MTAEAWKAVYPDGHCDVGQRCFRLHASVSAQVATSHVHAPSIQPPTPELWAPASVTGVGYPESAYLQPEVTSTGYAEPMLYEDSQNFDFPDDDSVPMD